MIVPCQTCREAGTESLQIPRGCTVIRDGWVAGLFRANKHLHKVTDRNRVDV